MNGTLILLVYVIVCIYFLLKRKSILGISLLYIILSPQILIGGKSINPIYFVTLFSILLNFFLRKTMAVPKKLKPYLILSLCSLFFYTIITIIVNKGDINGEGISSIIGSISIPILIISFSSLYKEELFEHKEYDFAFKSSLMINLVGVVAQSVYGAKVRNFFEKMYLTDSYVYYKSLSDNMVYNRKFGFCPSPMILGCFALMALVYFSCRKEKCKNYKLYVLVAFIVGIMSLSKTFILGVPVYCILSIILKLFKKNKTIIIKSGKIISNAILLLFILVIGTVFMKYMMKNTTITYYLKMILNPLNSLNTRYDTNETSNLFYSTYQVIKNNIIFGVGLQRVNNEFIGDSTYVMALHNGGLVSLISIVFYYIYNIVVDFKYKYNEKLYFNVMWAITGLAMTTFFYNAMIIPFLLAFYLSFEKEEI